MCTHQVCRGGEKKHQSDVTLEGLALFGKHPPLPRTHHTNRTGTAFVRPYGELALQGTAFFPRSLLQR